MHFASLVPAQAKQDAAGSPTSTAPANGTQLTKNQRSLLGFFLLPLSLVAGAMSFGLGGLGVWFAVFVTTYKKAGFSNAKGFWIALISLVVILVLMAVEMFLWLSNM
jgi:hypothetical protein